MRVAVVGAGFWARYQIAAWQEIEGVSVVGVCDTDLSKARQMGAFAAYDDLQRMLRETEPDLVDVITPVETHAPLVRAIAQHGLPVVCQKPMAGSLEEAEQMVLDCEAVPFFVHENWRFQAPLQRVKQLLDSSAIGRPFRARAQFSCSFPVFDNQPFLRTLDRFILTDIGSHILDVARFLFGEASRLYCQTSRVGDIAGEDVATVMMSMTGCDSVVCEMSYASRLREEAFPQTYLLIEGSAGSIELGKDYKIYVSTQEGLSEETVPVPAFPWADPAYDLVHSSIVACHRAILDDLNGRSDSGLRGADNLKTVQLVFASYVSAESGHVEEPPGAFTGQ